jgi:glycosyltransferase involved in cell wall biosynthesis
VRTDAQAQSRVLIVAPSLRILGGQAVQAARLHAALKDDASLEVDFLPINPHLPGALGGLQDVKYVRTVVTTLFFVTLLFWRVWRYDVVHLFSASYLSFLMAQTPAILVARFYRTSVILNYHSGEAADHLARWRYTAIPVMRLCRRIVVPSAYLVEVFSHFGLRAKAIFNIVDAPLFRFRLRRTLRPAFLANRNFEAHYAVATVLRAFAIVQRARPEASLVVAGDGSQRAELEALARQLELRHTIFTGAVAAERMPELYDAADIYLNGSEIDNMPLSILEAYAAGTPVVTTDAGGIPYILRHEETGLLVPVGDAEAMARAALRLLDDDLLAARLAQNAQRECAKYTAERTGREWVKLYRTLAQRTDAVGEGVKKRRATRRSY